MEGLRAGILFIFFVFISCNTDKTLPTIHLETEEKIGWKEKIECKVHFENGENKWSESGKIKRRGGASSLYKKMSFALELKDKVKFAGLPKDDDWILNANYIDKTFMRHVLSYELFRAMGENNVAAETVFVTLNINDEKQGLYVLMEEVNAGKAKVDKKDPYGMILKDPPIFFHKRPDTLAASSNYYQQKFPKINYRDNTVFIEAFMDTLFHESDAVFENEIAHWIDLDNVIDWHLLLLFTNNSDGIMKNFYLYKKNEKTPWRIAPWDYDHSFGRDGDNELNMITPLDCERSILLKRLLNTNAADYRVRLKKEWTRLVEENILTADYVNSFIERTNTLLSAEIKSNAEIWPTSAWYYKDKNSYEQEVELIQAYLQLRIPQVEAYIESL